MSANVTECYTCAGSFREEVILPEFVVLCRAGSGFFQRPYSIVRLLHVRELTPHDGFNRRRKGLLERLLVGFDGDVLAALGFGDDGCVVSSCESLSHSSSRDASRR
jgi:hypothetical protein